MQTTSATELNQQIRKLARLDQATTAELISKLAECQRRRTYLEEGYPSLFTFLTQGLGYSEREASDRFNAAKICLDVPEVADGLKRGLFTMTQISQVQIAVKREEKLARKKVAPEQKQELIQKIQGLSTRQTEKILSTTFEKSYQAKHKNRSHLKPLANGQVEITLQVSEETANHLERLREIFSHMNPGADLVDILELMIEDVRKKRDLSFETANKKQAQKKKPEGVQRKGGQEFPLKLDPTKSATTQSFDVTQKRIPAAIKRFVFQRDQGKCQHRKSDGTLCGSRHLVQFDHREPRFAGGLHRPDNLQLLCSVHN